MVGMFDFPENGNSSLTISDWAMLDFSSWTNSTAAVAHRYGKWLPLIWSSFCVMGGTNP